MKKLALSLAAGLLSAVMAAPASANYSQVITFGDSLSDNGNLFHLIGQPPAPYYNGRFSNGPVAVEVMSQSLGLSLTDFAYGGAQTGTTNLLGAGLNGTGVAGQIGYYGSLTGGHADASALYVVWAGPNDFFAGTNMLNPSTPVSASTNLLNDIQSLYSMGARDFFVPLMPNLGVTPSARQTDAAHPGFAAVATGQSLTYNSLLTSGLSSLSSTLTGVHIQTFDTYSFLMNQITVMNGEGKNTTDSCFNASVPSLCANPDNYLFWDGVHPTAAAHRVLGQAFAAAVPEPETYAMLLAGLGVAVLMQRRKAKQANEAEVA
ncbi:MAG TPA: SGNH/GDSL hydrolase family protein [Aquabacterium sp.]|nr:SGNH/GDSL hydrolase family protein [Aquabacterium sp.]